jgi:ATP-dependent helicase HepA
MSAGGGRVSILFPAADDRREYALESAPVRRVAFEVGDNLKTHDGKSGSIEEVKEEGGFLHYQVKGEWIPEAVLPIPSVFPILSIVSWAGNSMSPTYLMFATKP